MKTVCVAALLLAVGPYVSAIDLDLSSDGRFSNFAGRQCVLLSDRST
jgi:hypothetical protein